MTFSRDLGRPRKVLADEGELVGKNPRELPSETLALYHGKKIL